MFFVGSHPDTRFGTTLQSVVLLRPHPLDKIPQPRASFVMAVFVSLGYGWTPGPFGDDGFIRANFPETPPAVSAHALLARTITISRVLDDLGWDARNPNLARHDAYTTLLNRNPSQSPSFRWGSRRSFFGS